MFIIRRANKRVINSINEKQCTSCGEWLEENDQNFYYYNKSKFEKGLVSECKKCSILRSRKYNLENIEKYNENCRGYYARDINSSRENNRIKNQRWRDKGGLKSWEDNNKDRLTNYRINRQHKQHSITKEEWIRCKEYFDNACAYCGLPLEHHFKKYRKEMKRMDLHKEHVNCKGSNDISNCIPACSVCNSEKGTFEFDDWYSVNNPKFSIDRADKIHKWMKEDYLNLPTQKNVFDVNT